MAKASGPVFRLETLPCSPQEALTHQFCAWEQRGRGWQLWSEPVRLEPPFRPFYFHGVSSQPALDDGRRLGLVGSLIQRLSDWLSAPAGATEPYVDPEDNYSQPALDRTEESLIEFQLTLPSASKTSREATEEFLFSLGHCSGPIAFELIGMPDETLVQVVCRQRDRALFSRQLASYFPEVVVSEEPDFLARLWRAAAGPEPVVVDFALSEEFMMPLRMIRNFDHDPLIGLVGALSELEEDELGALQVLFQPTRHPWAESIFRSVTDAEGKAFFLDAPQMVALAKAKITRPLYAAVVRVAAQSPSPERAWRIVQGLGSALASLKDTQGNELIPLTNDDYDDELHEQDLIARASRRSGMLLNSDELISLVHFPSASVRSPKLRRETKRTKSAPALSVGHPLVLGENVHNGRTAKVSLAPTQRLRHMHVVGASGTGKSTFLLNMIVQDIERGDGLAVLDPHGDLIDAVLTRIPEERWGDVVLLDPSDVEFPVGFNILSAHSDMEKGLLASDLSSVFKRLSTNWGDQMNSVLGNAILAFLESDRGGTLAELRRFLVEKDYREDFLETVRDQHVVYYWRKEFPLLTGKPQGPLLTRLDIFLRPKPIRYMMAQKENKLDFARIMNEGKILLAKLSQGAIGEENAYLLGTLLVSKFHQLALSRQEMQESGRRDFYLYIDEFHNFVTPSMASILSGARKYHLGLILAHQEMRQLGRDSEVAGAVLANPYARVCFRLGDEDARKMADGFSFFEPKDLQNLGTGEAICRLERAEYDFNLQTHALDPVDDDIAQERLTRITELSRQRYGVRRNLVEAELQREWPAPNGTAAELLRSKPQSKITPEPEKAAAASTPPPASALRPLAPALPPIQEPESTLEISSPARVPAKPRAKPSPPETATPGRGGKQHKYIQQLIKQWAEGMGWRAEIEKTILDGAGCVDVALEKGAVTIACEISITTGVDQECANVDKCLKAGFGYIVAYTKRSKDAVPEQVRFLTIEEFFGMVEELESKAAGRESNVRGYKVSVKYRAVDDEEKKARKKALTQVILDSLKKMRK